MGAPTSIAEARVDASKNRTIGRIPGPRPSRMPVSRTANWLANGTVMFDPAPATTSAGTVVADGVKPKIVVVVVVDDEVDVVSAVSSTESTHTHLHP